jgi:hypothetical protein
VHEPATDNHLPRWKLIEGEALAALRELPSNSVDAVITDPPHSSGGLHLILRCSFATASFRGAASGMWAASFTSERPRRACLDRGHRQSVPSRRPRRELTASPSMSTSRSRREPDVLDMLRDKQAGVA